MHGQFVPLSALFPLISGNCYSKHVFEANLMLRITLFDKKFNVKRKSAHKPIYLFLWIPLNPSNMFHLKILEHIYEYIHEIYNEKDFVFKVTTLLIFTNKTHLTNMQNLEICILFFQVCIKIIGCNLLSFSSGDMLLTVFTVQVTRPQEKVGNFFTRHHVDIFDKMHQDNHKSNPYNFSLNW